MPFSESHFSRAQWLFYMIVAFSCLRSVMLLKWNQKRPIFVHFLRNYSVIRDACCCCHCYYCHCCSFDDFIFTRLRSHLMVSNLFYLIHMRNGNESILWMGLFMATNRFHFRVCSYINGKDRFCFRMHVFRFALSLFACGSSFWKTDRRRILISIIKSKFESKLTTIQRARDQFRSERKTTQQMCVCFGYLPIPFHLWVKACVLCVRVFMFILAFFALRHRFSVLFYKNPNDFGFLFPQIGFRIALLVFGFIYIKYVRTHTHSLTNTRMTNQKIDR